MERYVCVHGHFYQPPRENPWLGQIEVQDEVFPYHDWNERITAESYGPNGRSRILNGEGKIDGIVNNYSRMSFDFGPTLLSWLETNARDVYDCILAADRTSQKRFSGHGSAMAQAYNHIILPLGNSRDKYTQLVWGIRDFERRFGRRPEGMWLPETAVDLETLEMLAELGIQFTVLAPHQARRVRPLTGGAWQDVSDARIDPSRAYEIGLPSGRALDLFFYDGPASRAIAFERLLTRGEDFAGRLLSLFSPGPGWPQIAHVATDGETYGHHHRFGDMALAYALEFIETNDLAALTNYGEYLDRCPPTHEVEIYENTSWSCSHGIERWRSDCGCNTGGPMRSQAWRKPLRDALDFLRDEIACNCEAKAPELFGNFWAARNDYIDVVLDRSPESLGRFFARHANHQLSPEEMTTALKLLEMQHHAMLMYTSCGWFFDDISGIETVQVMQYAGRAIQLAQEVFGDHMEDRFLERLAEAKSNDPARGDGAQIYRRYVQAAKVDLTKVAAHYAVSGLFRPYDDEARVYLYDVRRLGYHTSEAGRTKFAVGRINVRSEITLESAELAFAVLHFGDHNINGGVGVIDSPERYQALVDEATAAFGASDLTELIRVIDEYFPGPPFSLRSLFRDEQRDIIRRILGTPMEEAEDLYRQFYQEHVSLMRFLNSVGYPMPNRFRAAAEIALNLELRRAFDVEDIDVSRVRTALDQAHGAGVEIDSPGVSIVIKRTVEKLAEEWSREPMDASILKELVKAAELSQQPPFQVDLWRTQNIYYDAMHQVLPKMTASSEAGDADAATWVSYFLALGEVLKVTVS